MNEKLKEAEDAMVAFLTGKAGGATMAEVLAQFQGRIAEAELRAAVWTLRAEGTVDFCGADLIGIVPRN